MLRIAVCDDSPAFRESAREMIEHWSDETGVPVELHLCADGDGLLSLCASERMDLVFLDILMPLLNGLDTARELRARDTAVRIVFLTSSPEFALESYDVRAQGYLLKPADEKKVWAVLAEAATVREREPKNLVVRTSFGYQKLYLHEIEVAEAQNKRVIFHLRGEREIETAQPLYSFEHTLTDENGFFKCHRSYLVYLPAVDRFSATEVVTKSGRRIPIARGYARAFKEAYFALMFGE